MKQKPTITIGHIKITDHLVLGVTKDKYDKRQEIFDYLNLKTQRFVGWNPLANALKNGDIDGAFILAPLAMDLFASDIKIRLVLFGHKSGSIIVTNKRANIKKIEDFSGKIILIPHNLSIHHIIMRKLLEENGLSVGLNKDVILEVCAPSQIPMAIQYDETGQIGGFIVAEPFGTQVVSEGYGEEFRLSKDIWPNHPCCVLVMRDEIIAKYPNAVQELTSSFVKSGNFISDNPEEASEIGAVFLEQKAEVIKHVLTEPPDRVIYTGLYPNINDLEKIQKYMSESIYSMYSKIKMGKFVDTQFAEEAKAE